MINQTPGSLIVNGRLWVKCELDSSMKISFVFTEKKKKKSPNLVRLGSSVTFNLSLCFNFLSG